MDREILKIEHGSDYEQLYLNKGMERLCREQYFHWICGDIVRFWSGQSYSIQDYCPHSQGMTAAFQAGVQQTDVTQSFNSKPVCMCLCVCEVIACHIFLYILLHPEKKKHPLALHLLLWWNVSCVCVLPAPPAAAPAGQWRPPSPAPKPAAPGTVETNVPLSLRTDYLELSASPPSTAPEITHAYSIYTYT